MSNYTIAVSGILLSLAASFHCVAMCGPISMALPIHQFSFLKKNKLIILYNVGRIISYSILGFIVGLIGANLYFVQYQQGLSIVLGTIMLFVVVYSFFSKNKLSSNLYSSFIQKIFRNYFQKEKNTINYFILGFLNGLLPCGFVYIAIMSSFLIPTINGSILFMMSFGLGTFIVMYTFMFISKLTIWNRFRKINFVKEVMIVSIALLLITRGLNLNIPYISPKLYDKGKEISYCGK